MIRRKVPIRIKNVQNPRGGGTVIHPDPDSDVPSITPPVPEPYTLKSLHDLASTTEDSQRKRLPTAVTIKEHIIVLNVNSNRKSVSHGFLAGIFGTLDKFGVVVDLISTSEVHVSMAIEDGLAKKVLDRLVKELRKTGTVRNKKKNPYLVVSISCSLILLFFFCFSFHVETGHNAQRHGYSLPRWQADAQYGWYRRKNVYYSCTRQCQYRNDQPRSQRDQYILRYRSTRRGQSPQLDSSKLSTDQT